MAARRQFGNITLLQEDRRNLQTLPSVEALWHDLRYALRIGGRTGRLRPWRSSRSAWASGRLRQSSASSTTSCWPRSRIPMPMRLVFPRIYDTREGPEIGRQGYSPAEVLDFVEHNHVFDATSAAHGGHGRLPGTGPEPSR